VRTIGAGSTFHLAVVRYAGRECICKRLRMRLLDEPKAHSVLRREALALDLLRLDSVPDLLELGEDDRGPYVLQSRLVGATLRELVDGFRARGSGVPRSLVRLVMEGSFRALAEIHALRDEDGPLELVHGDLAPDHVLLDRDGHVSFADFGLARWRGMSEIAEPSELGSLPFVAPELARGEHVPDQSCDVFALAGAVAFLALGRDPCAGATPAARLVEVSEQGLDTAAIERLEGIDSSTKEGILGALRFDRATRARRAEAVLRLVAEGDVSVEMP
jgi:serine/threonine-protein kinase